MENKPKNKLLAMAVASALATLAWTPAYGQEGQDSLQPAQAQQGDGGQGAPAAPSEAPTAAGAPAITTVEVTGSRLKGGFVAPTPLTAVAADSLNNAAPNNLADGLNQLPQFRFTSRTSNPNTAVGNGPGAGQNVLGLRGFGGNRTLVLLNGHRLPSSNSEGSVDINTIPQALVKRVDVVTGGASAAYGSDAVSGVVNFVLDTRKQGWSGDLGAGVSAYHDLPSKKFSLAGGDSFLDDRLHVVASAEGFYQSGLRADQTTGRPWFDVAKGLVPNPVAGALPKQIVIDDIRSALGAYGGLITSGPLAGTQFLPGGRSAPFSYGALRSTSYQSGGDGPRMNIGFAPQQDRVNLFSHAEFELTPEQTLFAEAGYAQSHTNQGAFVNPHVGSSNQYTIFRDNAFLPADILARMTAANVQSFTMGRYERDFPLVEIEGKNTTKRLALGARGELGGGVSYDASYSWGRTNLSLAENNVTNNRRLYAAVDAVRDPASGNIVCRSTLSGLDAGCVPLNLFGTGSPSSAAIAFVTGNSVKDTVLTQQVAAFNVHGALPERYSLGSGPVALASGVELRKESVDQTTDALSPTVTSTAGLRGAPTAQNNRPGAFNFHNPLPLAGSYDVKEAYAEAGIPLLGGLAYAKSMQLDLAARRAIYSNSGGVNTWKAGLNYLIDDPVRLRITRSRDIRGPNTLELFNSGTQGNSVNLYKGVPTQTLAIASGNPNLRPEVASTLTYGMVLQPAFVPGLSLSVDRYRISLRDAIATLSQQDTINLCESGNKTACEQVSVTPSGTLVVRTPTLNLNAQRTSGIDLEAEYARRMADGKLTLRLVASREDEFSLAPAGGGFINNSSAAHAWRTTAQATYAIGPWRFFLQQRFLPRSIIDTSKVEGVDVANNHVPAYRYTDISLARSVKWLGMQQELYVNVGNLFNKAPPVAPGNPTSFSKPTLDAYDTIGRYISAGMKFKF